MCPRCRHTDHGKGECWASCEICSSHTVPRAVPGKVTTEYRVCGGLIGGEVVVTLEGRKTIEDVVDALREALTAAVAKLPESRAPILEGGVLTIIPAVSEGFDRGSKGQESSGKDRSGKLSGSPPER